ncbi:MULTISPECIES: hypothetical protein [Streptomyces]|uniref:Integral membrane protein n=2 Tax=Streptomyces TaxID=1883 RepID=A0A420UW40_9ACTN|nr:MULTISPECIES: hypothetical protein [Streptomyces]KNE81287.1 membrane protein [Streptomyces fradiae]OFA57851.1 hypothetical protein BEN35_04775 [Streptomyces fradiae]PQM23682.1 hypothetical protein Sfr7A_08575 [Streptomyces xinghaiensis]RKM91670.1 hypothetical protein SFRA_027095 [Streptomyces xinghaiensis]RNC73375.1 hypothetical protein DC095_014695 [Streptomyces xinghaiensis]
MAATEETATDEDALFVLTAVLLTPARFPSVLGDDFPEVCAALGLEPYEQGYGLVLGQDGGGARWTVVIDDVSLVACALAAWDCGMEYDLSPDERSVVSVLPGWPLAVAVSAPGVPAPHDPPPDPDGGRPPLAPPDAQTWGPAQRRLGADEIALRWAVWREEYEGAEEPSGSGGDDAADGPAGAAEAAEAAPPAAPAESARPSDGGEPSNEGVRRVLREAHAYVETPPPLGRVRSEFASDGARTLRADGPGWSLVARTDDMAFVLLDDMPGDVIPVGRGPKLPALLRALDEMAAKPA